ncbi:acetyl-CoA acetyltransferase [Ochromonadaceae sp. CCMP2298]|nr:acetyl-CoA acetyltransferase [Ochromonadaceae sp. CCMP2298]
MLAKRGLASSGRRLFSSSLGDRDIVVVSIARTPIGKIGGALSSLSAPKLGAHAIASAVDRAGISNKAVEEVFFGNVLSANIGQAPARQAVVHAGLELSTSCTTVNKVCASGMKALMLSSLSIMSGYRSVCVAGGMESMSNVPYYLPGARTGYRLGNSTVVDGLVTDGLWDVYNDQHMGNCGDLCASKYSITREDQDAFSIESYSRAAKAWDSGVMANEVVPVSIAGKRGAAPTIVECDEEYTSVNLAKVKTLRPAFSKDGTVTAANASKLSDGAAAMVVVSGKFARENKLTPLFRIRGFGDAERAPAEFTVAPSDAVPLAYAHAGVSASDVQFHEINEAFSVVSLVNASILGLDLATVNVHGGAVALGHPLGCSGARIIGSLYNVLKAKDATIGCASICNGGGGASAIVIERLN